MMVTLIAMGGGTVAGITCDAVAALSAADLILGAERLLNDLEKGIVNYAKQWIFAS